MTAPVPALQPGMRVRVHYNLHRGDFSVIDPRIGRVVANVSEITLTDATFRVQPGGLRTMRERKQRAVCAYAIGYVAEVEGSRDLTGYDRVTFNPWRADTFTRDGAPVHAAPQVTFRDRAGWTPAGAR